MAQLVCLLIFGWVMISGLWDQALHQALCLVVSLLEILSLPLPLSVLLLPALNSSLSPK